MTAEPWQDQQKPVSNRDVFPEPIWIG